MAATLIAGRWVWASFIVASLWFIWVSLILIKTTFTTTGGGTPGFVVWAIFAAAVMNYGVEHIPARTC